MCPNVCAHYFNPFTRRMDFVMCMNIEDEHQRCFRKAGNSKKPKKNINQKEKKKMSQFAFVLEQLVGCMQCVI